MTDEWTIYESVRSSGEFPSTSDDLDTYWKNVGNLKTAVGCAKFPSLTKLARNLIVLSHGNSEPERGFSANKQLVTDMRCSLS